MRTYNINLTWFAFWIFMAVYAWASHTQYLAGHETMFWGHKTPEEIRIREATVKKLELEAKGP